MNICMHVVVKLNITVFQCINIFLHSYNTVRTSVQLIFYPKKKQNMQESSKLHIKNHFDPNEKIF